MIVIRYEWGSAGNPRHREEIREALLAHFRKEFLFVPEDAILDLSKPLLKFANQYVSISHSRSCGGFLVMPQPCGFDLEDEERLTTAVVARVSSSEEMSRCPSPALLWSAKEAVFKALQHFRPATLISQIEIDEWQDLAPGKGIFLVRNLETFGAPAGRGCFIIENGRINCAFTFVDSTLV